MTTARRLAERAARLGRALPPLASRGLAQAGKRRTARALVNTYWSNYINLSLAFRGERSDLALRRTALGAVLGYVRNGAYYLAPELWPGFELHNGAVLDRVVASGRGALLACQHVGPQRFAFLEVASRGRRVNVTMSQAFVDRAHRWFELARGALGAEQAEAIDRIAVLPPVEDPAATRELVRALRRGELVMFDVDGNTGVGGEARTLDEGLPLRFLGREIRVRKGVAQLAYRTGAPVVPLMPRWGRAGRPELHVHEPIVPAPGEGVERFVERCMGELYGLLERQLRLAPEQWENWSHLAKWSRPPARRAAGGGRAPKPDVDAIRALVGREPGAPVAAPPGRVFVLRVRGRRVLVDAPSGRFFLTSACGAALVRALEGGATLGPLVRRLSRAFPERAVLEELGRLAAFDIVRLPVNPGAVVEGKQGMQPNAKRQAAGGAATLVDVARAHASSRPDDRAFLFLADEGGERPLSYAGLDRAARSVAARLGERLRPGDRALLLFPPGADFVAAFFGCLYAGVVAVPCPLPEPSRLARTAPRLLAIARDAELSVVLTAAECVPALRDALAGAEPGRPPPSLLAVGVDDVAAADAWHPAPLGPSDLAFLQYTSGSTSRPRGVMINHGNLLDNLRAMRQSFDYAPGSVKLGWGPHFHDEGLIHGIAQPVYSGIPCVRMSHLAVVKDPLHWLRTIERYRATHAGGPNFVYELCLRRIDPAARRGLDLSSWRCAYNAAEPIRASTLEAFARAFEVSGFRREATFPCYGLAESTVLASASRVDHGWLSRRVDVDALERTGEARPPRDEGARARELVSSGRPIAGSTLRVVDPERRVALPPGRVGEIWLAGPSVSTGYWRQPEETAATFGAKLEGEGDTPFLRTGDQGFVSERGELFVTGRSKDVVILRGRTIAPQDVELAAERSHPALRPGCGAVFGVDLNGEEKLALVHEIDPARADPPGPVFEAILKALSEEHELVPGRIVLVGPRTIAKTSSGKIQRGACKRALLGGELAALAAWPPSAPSAAKPPHAAATAPPVAAADGAARPGAADGASYVVAVNGAASHATVPNGAASHATVPNGAASHAAVPNGAASRATVPNGAASHATMPNGAASHATMPNGAASHPDRPNGVASRPDRPNGAASYADATNGVASHDPAAPVATPGAPWPANGPSAASRAPAAGAASEAPSAPRAPDAGAASSAARADEMIAWLRPYADERINSRLIDERRCIPPYVVLDLGNRGFLGMLAPARHGGLALRAPDVARLVEQLAAIDLTLASFVSGHNVLGVSPIARHGTEAARAELLPALAAGRELGALAMTEEGAGSNPRAIATTARPDGEGGWVLRGKKIWSGSSSWAGVVNVFARLEGAGEGGHVAFAVRQGSRGLGFGPEDLTMGLRGMVQNSVVLDDVRVGPGRLLGRPGGGMDVAQDTFAFGRFVLGAASLGVMKRSAQLMLRYASRRTVATGRLLDDPVTLARLGELTAAIDALGALVGATAGAIDADGAPPADAAVACKVLGAELAWRAADDAMQTLGGRGYVETNLLPQLLRDARLLRIFEGPTEALEAFLGARALHEAAELRALVGGHFGAPAAADRLADAVDRIGADWRGGARPGASRAWAHHRAGVVAAHAILWAAAASAARARPSLARAAEWARRRFEDAVDRALRANASDAAALPAADLESLVARYADSVGDVEQRHAGELRALDPLLRTSGGPVPSAPEPPAPRAPALAAPPPPEAVAPVEPPPPADRPSSPPRAEPYASPMPAARPHVASAAVVAAQPHDAAALTPPAPPRDAVTAAAARPRDGAASESARIQDWLVQWLARHAGHSPEALDVQASLASQGMDSVTAVLLVEDLERWLGRTLRADLAWAHPTISALAHHLAAPEAAPSPRA